MRGDIGELVELGIAALQRAVALFQQQRHGFGLVNVENLNGDKNYELVQIFNGGRRELPPYIVAIFALVLLLPHQAVQLAAAQFGKILQAAGALFVGNQFNRLHADHFVGAVAEPVGHRLVDFNYAPLHIRQ